MNKDIGKVVDEMQRMTDATSEHGSIDAAVVRDWKARLQSSGNVCQGLTDEQWWELYVAMDDVTPPNGPFSTSAVATAARAYLAALPKGGRDA